MVHITQEIRSRRWLRWCFSAVATVLFATLLCGLLGMVVRDRWPMVGLLVYVPLVPLGLMAVICGLAARGRGLPKVRWALGVTGLVSIAAGTAPGTLGQLPELDSEATPGPIVLHWNARWGGGGGGADGKQESWDSICRDIARQAPDIVLLSESPREDRIAHLKWMLGSEWTSAVSQNQPRAPYLYRLVVLSRWPVTLEREAAIPTGRVMQAVVAAPGGDMRVLIADGESHPCHDRIARLRAVAQFCRRAEQSSQPIDLIAGDFNAVSRSIGFDALVDAGYHLATRRRATWPSICPIYDIDHIWLGQHLSIARLVRLTNLATDHCGHAVRLVRQRRPTPRNQ